MLARPLTRVVALPQPALGATPLELLVVPAAPALAADPLDPGDPPSPPWGDPAEFGEPPCVPLPLPAPLAPLETPALPPEPGTAAPADPLELGGAPPALELPPPLPPVSDTELAHAAEATNAAPIESACLMQ